MTTIDYTLLFAAKPVLGLDFDRPGRTFPWLVIDRANHDRTYYKTATLNAALDFVAAQVAKGDAAAFVEDIEFWRAWRLSLGHSVMAGRAWRVAQTFGTLSERGDVATSRPGRSPELAGPGKLPANGSSPPLSESVLATVHPFPKMHEPLDESA